MKLTSIFWLKQHKYTLIILMFQVRANRVLTAFIDWTKKVFNYTKVTEFTFYYRDINIVGIIAKLP